eukprot:TRINITY_DN10223_c0_g1_i2.p1 TRINITY_DN10223_c0_g1~~TRINITY_DN10223_c0_g1_i2.p1  ORF type:complete len:128 (-),score=26.12 TRINITY_DN10223_c0_g1_i2:185-568(-)
MAEVAALGQDSTLEPENERQRFLIELEFVQCLASPRYLNFLAQRKYFDDAAFVSYLKYLLYWKQPAYARFIIYPQCLKFLDLLQHDEFRKSLVSSETSEEIHRQQFWHWQFYRNQRLQQTPPTAANQ